jgi:hypothetical protein
MLFFAMLLHKKRIYVDTSVIGGCHDAEFSVDSRALIALALRGRVTLLLSTIVIVQLDRIKGYNIVNRGLGYPDLVIETPTVVTHEQKEE